MRHHSPSSAPPVDAKALIPGLLASGMAHHSAGRLAEAEQAYRQILAADSQHPDALHLMGVLALQVNKPAVAADLIAQAIRGNPGSAIYFSNLGSALRRLGRIDDSIAACREATRLDRSLADGFNNLANALTDRQLYGEAADALTRLVALRPQAVEQRLLLANTLMKAGRPADAVDALNALLRIDGRNAPALNNLGVCLRKLKRNEEAEAAYRRALEIAPDDAGMLSNYGTLLMELERTDDAIALFRTAIGHKPDFGEAHLNLGLAYRSQMRLAEAVPAMREGVRLCPDLPEAHAGLGELLLLDGQLEEGFREYDWRSRMADFPSPRRDFTAPRWDGVFRPGLTLLVHDEQGVGDTMQFVRFAQIAQARGARVIVECNTQLTRLLDGMPGVDRVIGRTSPLPPHDAHVPLLSLPQELGISLDTIPAEVPYLRTEPGLVSHWGERLAALPASGTGLRVGLVWAGSPEHKNDRNRSLALARLAPLAGVANARFVSLQKGAGAGQAANPPPGMELVDLGPEIGNFADTAAILQHLDLLVTVDTSVAHLAGALGRPVWVLLPFFPDWRWLHGTDASPWYPTMRLFRQERPRDWEPVIARVADALRAMADGVRPA
ncbi:tetratricopeptide repeat protein [Azospirillum agricola]|uniref:tetratricopeptide repeat-containing glycosyltransferase family protein n=1 Tax=Azospirillum agricola TaxID=1720247 RepID=UPI000A0EF5B4|nr:tetratricopeptide repeat-containing glycosyltransferase family protein [Azospirillum agricola]SMH41067.1 Tetratricopeptide (TPR) repeat [Azospirillum lipoferum]